MIIVTYTSVDFYRKRSSFKTLAGARKFAAKWVGEFPSIGTGYAVSDDGIGKITVSGATLADLFPGTADDNDGVRVERDESDWCEEDERAWQQAAARQASTDTARRETGCTCSEQQLNLVGCDCRHEEKTGLPPGFDDCPF
jgi:hypothetical protein